LCGKIPERPLPSAISPCHQPSSISAITLIISPAFNDNSFDASAVKSKLART